MCYLYVKQTNMTDSNTQEKEAAKMLRAELKAAFPKTKFSVRLQRASMMTSLWTTWIDGPTVKQVRYYSDKYAFGSEYNNKIDNLPQTKFSQVSRNISDESEAFLLEVLKKKYPDIKISNKLTDFIPTLGDYVNCLIRQLSATYSIT